VQWNTEAQASGNNFNPAPFLVKQEELVQTTRAALKRSLSAVGMLKFDAFIQSEKKAITIHTGGAQ
jgi:hypothetical protein